MMNFNARKAAREATRNRLINDATSLIKQPLGQSRYRMVVHRGRNIDSPLNQQLLTHMAA
ncbi:hypothetical protein AAHU43_11130 [Klebsiella variicola subsp. variicola]|uniref:hypothetical protein n=1 Tax=Klebsiella variicola TaxID=244366 RepID=UPI0035A0AA57